MKVKYLYEENGFLYFRNEKGRIDKHPKNKFSDGEIVALNEHYSKKGITRLKEPSYTKNRGWVYVENYMDIQGLGNGCGMWNNEERYDNITDPKFVMIAKRIEIKEDILKTKKKLKSLEADLHKLEFAMTLSVKNYDTATHACVICGQLFEGFKGGDPNKDKCTKCLSNET